MSGAAKRGSATRPDGPRLDEKQRVPKDGCEVKDTSALHTGMEDTKKSAKLTSNDSTRRACRHARPRLRLVRPVPDGLVNHPPYRLIKPQPRSVQCHLVRVLVRARSAPAPSAPPPGDRQERENAQPLRVPFGCPGCPQTSKFFACSPTRSCRPSPRRSLRSNAARFRRRRRRTG